MRKLFAMMLLACITAGANAQEKKSLRRQEQSRVYNNQG